MSMRGPSRNLGSIFSSSTVKQLPWTSKRKVQQLWLSNQCPGMQNATDRTHYFTALPLVDASFRHVFAVGRTSLRLEFITGPTEVASTLRDT